MAASNLLERALRGEAVERPPVWAMRQAGRWDPQFQALRAGHTFYEFAENAELAAKASLCPLRFGVDAIILFYDITTLAVGMGQSFQLVPERGPVPDTPIRTAADVAALTADPAGRSVDAVHETLRYVRQEVGPDFPILVFAGAPFTLATYQIGTGKDLDAVRRFAAEQPDVWESLLEVTATATVGFLRGLVDAGAAAYQLFDSWAGALSQEEYDRWAAPYHERIFGAVGGPSILFVKELPSEWTDTAVASGPTCISLGTQHDLAALRERHPSMVWQGNVDHELLVHGGPDDVRAATRACLAAGGGQRHVVNLDHGMDRSAKVENFAAFVETARAGLGSIP